MATSPTQLQFGPQDIEGPFMKALGQRYQQAQQPLQPSGFEKPVAAAALLANNFLQGITAGRLERYQKEEYQKAQRLDVFQQYVNNILSDPNLPPETRSQISQKAIQIYGQTIGTADEGHKGDKKKGLIPPDQSLGGKLVDVFKQIGVGMAGGQLPKGKKLDLGESIQEIEAIRQQAQKQGQGTIQQQAQGIAQQIYNVIPTIKGTGPGGKPNSADILSNQTIQPLLDKLRTVSPQIATDIEKRIEKGYPVVKAEEQIEQEKLKDLQAVTTAPPPEQPGVVTTNQIRRLATLYPSQVKTNVWANVDGKNQFVTQIGAVPGVATGFYDQEGRRVNAQKATTPSEQRLEEREKKADAGRTLAGKALSQFPNDQTKARQWVAMQPGADAETISEAMKTIGQPPRSTSPAAMVRTATTQLKQIETSNQSALTSLEERYAREARAIETNANITDKDAARNKLSIDREEEKKRLVNRANTERQALADAYRAQGYDDVADIFMGPPTPAAAAAAEGRPTLPQRMNNPVAISGRNAGAEQDTEGNWVKRYATPEEGWQAGRQLLAEKLKAKPEMTIRGLAMEWTRHPEKVNSWSNAVARQIGITQDTKAKDVNPEALLHAMSVAEGFTAQAGPSLGVSKTAPPPEGPSSTSTGTVGSFIDEP